MKSIKFRIEMTKNICAVNTRPEKNLGSEIFFF